MPSQTAKLFWNGRSQAIRLPSEFRFEGKEVFIRREGENVILSPKPASWDDFFDPAPRATEDFMVEREDLPAQDRETCSSDGTVSAGYGHLLLRLPQSPRTGAPTNERSALDQQAISIVTYAELLYGVRRSSSKRINRRVVDAFVRHLFILDWNREVAEHYAEIRTTLGRKGKPIGGMDMLIAAHALSLNAVVVTNNARHFGEVPSLSIENWTHEDP